MRGGEKKHGSGLRFGRSKDRINKEKEPEIKFMSKKVPTSNLEEVGSKHGEMGMAGDEANYQTPTDFSDHPFDSVDLSKRPSFCNNPTPPVDDSNYDTPLEKQTSGSSDTTSSHLEKSAEEFNIHSLSISSSEMDRSESGNAPRIQTPSEHETSPMLCRDPKQDALLNELNRRILKSRSFSDDTTVPRAARPKEVASNPVTKKFSMDSALRGTKPSTMPSPQVPLKNFSNDKPRLGERSFEVVAPPVPPKNSSNDKQRLGERSSEVVAPPVPPKNFAMVPPPAAAMPLRVPTPTLRPKRIPEQIYSNKRILWLMIENIPMAQEKQSRFFKNNDIVRWLDFDAKYLESNPPPLPENAYLECETWPGEFVVVPSEYARLITSSLELSNLLQCRPRAQVTENFVGANDDDLSVTAGEVIYLLSECNNTHFMAMNKNFVRGKVPKRVLSVLLAP